MTPRFAEGLAGRSYHWPWEAIARRVVVAIEAIVAGVLIAGAMYGLLAVGGGS